MKMRSHNHFPQRSQGLGDRLKQHRDKLKASAALLLAVTAIGMGLKANADSNREDYEREQKALEQVIEPEMQQLGDKVLGLTREHPEKFVTTLIDGSKMKITGDKRGNEHGRSAHRGIDMVLGTDQNGDPDPDKLLFFGCESSTTPVEGPGRIWTVAYTAPGGGQYAATEAYRYGDVPEGWSAVHTDIITSGAYAVTEMGEILDTSDSRYFSQDAHGDPTDAPTTAEAIGPMADKLCDFVTTELVN